MPSELGDRTQLPKGVGWAVAVGLSSAWGMMDGLGSPPHPALGTISGHRILWWLSKIFIKPTCSIQRKTLFLSQGAAKLGKTPPDFPTHQKRSAGKQLKTPAGLGAQRNQHPPEVAPSSQKDLPKATEGSQGLGQGFSCMILSCCCLSSSCCLRLRTITVWWEWWESWGQKSHPRSEFQSSEMQISGADDNCTY